MTDMNRIKLRLRIERYLGPSGRPRPMNLDGALVLSLLKSLDDKDRELTAPARIRWMHARCVYIRELLSEGEEPTEIARLLSCDTGQVRLLGMTDPDSIIEPFRRSEP